MNGRKAKVGVAVALVLVLIGGIAMLGRSLTGGGETAVVGYFNNSNGIFVGDPVTILGVEVGKIDKIEPEPQRVKISFAFDDKYKVPADAKAVILSPQLVTLRSIQLVPAYTDGPVLADGAVIPEERTAVPTEFDDLRAQLEKLTELLQPTEPGGVSTLGALITTAADNLRGNGADIRDTVVRLSQAVSALSDHSDDLFGSFKNLSTLVSALKDSSALIEQLNQNLADVTGLLANDPNEVGNALDDLNSVVGDLKTFVADNRESLGTTSEKLANVSNILVESLDDIKQTLHIGAPAFQNFINIYQPAQGTLTGALAGVNFANTISFLCGALQAASRLGAEQSAKLCVQYLAPIIKNRQINYLPLGLNPFVGATARPNEVTYSEDWLRPDYVPPPGPAPSPEEQEAAAAAPVPPNGPLPPANGIFNRFGEPANPAHGDPPFLPGRTTLPKPFDPNLGFPGMLMPPGGGQ